jgi:hypothetical protein
LIKIVLATSILLGIVQPADPIANGGQKQTLLQSLNEAKAFLSVLPEKSLSILANNSVLNSLSAENQIDWHVAKLNAARQLSNLPLMADSSGQIIELRALSETNKVSTFVVNQMGIWFRRSGYLNEAKLSYLCTVDKTNEISDRLRAISNLAVVERNQGNFHNAKILNNVALKIAKKQREASMIALIENNLGILAMDQDNAELASQHFRVALDLNHHNLRRSSEILNGINLLFSFVELERYGLYARFYPRVIRLLEAYPSEARIAYLNWIHQTYLFRQNKHLSEQHKNQLLSDYDKVNDSGIQGLLYPYSQELGIDINPPNKAENKTFTGDWLSRIDQCDWDKYRTMSYATLLETIYSSGSI